MFQLQLSYDLHMSHGHMARFLFFTPFHGFREIMHRNERIGTMTHDDGSMVACWRPFRGHATEAPPLRRRTHTMYTSVYPTNIVWNMAQVCFVLGKQLRQHRTFGTSRTAGEDELQLRSKAWADTDREAGRVHHSMLGARHNDMVRSFGQPKGHPGHLPIPLVLPH